MSYLQLLPTDLIKEISKYLTEIETKHILKIRNYIDFELVTWYMDKDDGILCHTCKRYDRHHNMKSINENNYCAFCSDNFTHCHSYKCNNIAGTMRDSHKGKCILCEKSFCLNHSYLIKYCYQCQNPVCYEHYSAIIIGDDDSCRFHKWICYSCKNKN